MMSHFDIFNVKMFGEILKLLHNEARLITRPGTFLLGSWVSQQDNPNPG